MVPTSKNLIFYKKIHFFHLLKTHLFVVLKKSKSLVSLYCNAMCIPNSYLVRTILNEDSDNIERQEHDYSGRIEKLVCYGIHQTYPDGAVVLSLSVMF